MSDEHSTYCNDEPHVDYDPSVELTNYRRDALQAVLRRDYDTARTLATNCLLILSTIPDGSLAGLSSQSWNRQGIVEFLAQLDRMEAATATADSGGMLLQDYQYTGRRSC